MSQDSRRRGSGRGEAAILGDARQDRYLPSSGESARSRHGVQRVHRSMSGFKPSSSSLSNCSAMPWETAPVVVRCSQMRHMATMGSSDVDGAPAWDGNFVEQHGVATRCRAEASYQMKGPRPPARARRGSKWGRAVDRPGARGATLGAGGSRKQTWRKGSRGPLSASFCAVRVHSGAGRNRRLAAGPDVWLLLERDPCQQTDVRYYLSSISPPPNLAGTRIASHLHQGRCSSLVCHRYSPLLAPTCWSASRSWHSTEVLGQAAKGRAGTVGCPRSLALPGHRADLW